MNPSLGGLATPPSLGTTYLARYRVSTELLASFLLLMNVLGVAAPSPVEPNPTIVE